MLNHVTLLGRLAQEPEVKVTQSGISVTSFDLAVNVPSKDQSKEPDYIPIVCWDKKAEFASRYLSKGRQIVVEGRISTRRYTDNDNKTRKVVEVVASQIYFADSGNREDGNSPAPTYSASAPNFEEINTNDDDLPF